MFGFGDMAQFGTAMKVAPHRKTR